MKKTKVTVTDNTQKQIIKTTTETPERVDEHVYLGQWFPTWGSWNTFWGAMEQFEN